MSFFQSTIRQEGFHPENQDMSYSMNDQFAARKHSISNTLDFNDELVSLIDPNHDRQPPNEDPYRASAHTHNIFDTSVSLHDYHGVNHFNSTLPALNSSMRYEPHPPATEPPPSSFNQHPSFVRQTPSPHLPQQQQPQQSRSRSRSRPPSSSGGIGPQRTTRTRRNGSISSTSPPPHHFNSIGMMNNMSRPPPQAIVIPGARSNQNNTAGTPVSPHNGPGTTWFMPGTANNGEYALPTPDSLHSNHSFHSGMHHQHGHHHHFSSSSYASGFSLSPSESHLAAASALHNAHGAHPGSLPKAVDAGIGIGTPTSTVGLPSSLPVTSSHHSNGAASGNGTATATPTPGVSAPSGPDKQAMLASEKRRRRRESHNAVERRRRDNINEKISELATLIPECMLDGTVAPNGTAILANAIPMDSPTLAHTSPSALNMGGPLSAMSPIDCEGADPWDAMLPPTNGTLPKKEKESDGTLLGSLPISNDGENGLSANGLNAGVVKANKGMILRKSVDYIRYLQQLVSAQGERNRELEAELRNYRDGAPAPSSNHLDNAILYPMNGQWSSYSGLGSMPPLPEDHKENGRDHGADSPLTNTTSPESAAHDYPSDEGRKEVRGRKRSVKARADGAADTLTGARGLMNGNSHPDDHDMSDTDERMDL